MTRLIEGYRRKRRDKCNKDGGELHVYIGMYPPAQPPVTAAPPGPRLSIPSKMGNDIIAESCTFLVEPNPFWNVTPSRQFFRFPSDLPLHRFPAYRLPYQSTFGLFLLFISFSSNHLRLALILKHITSASANDFSQSKPSDFPIMSTSARRRLMRDFKVRVHIITLPSGVSSNICSTSSPSLSLNLSSACWSANQSVFNSTPKVLLFKIRLR